MRETVLVFVLLVVTAMGIAYAYWITRKLLEQHDAMYKNLTR